MEEPMEDDYVEKSSTYVHKCPLCGSVRTGTSSLWQHLASVHQKRLVDVGRWVHCSACDANFSHDSTWRLHLQKKNCPQTAMSIRWREKRREDGESEEEEDESALIGLDGRSKPMKDLKKRRRGNEEEEEGKGRKTPFTRPYMKQRDGWIIVHQTTNFRCEVCRESDLPTLASLVYHQRKQHSMQLSQVEQWLRCFGCGQDAASLSWIRNHIADVAATAYAAGEQPACNWKTAALVWQVEETSEEARRFRDGLDPVAPSSSSSTLAALLNPQTTSSSSTPGVKQELIDEDGAAGGSTTAESSSRKRKHQQRVDKSYILPRPGHTVVRRQANMGGFATCPSVDHHMRKVHKAGIHQASMWMHCGRCGHDFCNISSVRTHVSAAEGGDGESCGWPSIYMCWHERNGDNAKSGITVGPEASDQPGSSFHANLPSSMCEFVPQPKRHRKLFKPPSIAQEGYEIVKRIEDLPCFGCGCRCASLTSFIWCMQGKHRLYFSDVGAWMECACGRAFTSTTALRVHLREEGGEGENACSMPFVSLCWQRKVGGRETETPQYGGVSDAFLADGDVYDPALGWMDPMASGVVKEEVFEVKEEPVEYEEDSEILGGPPLSDLPQPFGAQIAPSGGYSLESGTLPAPTVPQFDTQSHTGVPQWRKNRGRPNAGSHSICSPSDVHPVQYRKVRGRPTASNRVQTAGYSTDSGDNPVLFEPLAAGVVKEEQNEVEGEMDEEVIMSEEMEMEEEVAEQQEAKRLATFDPTGYADGDRFVLRKTKEMGCRTCGEICSSPSDLAVHVWSAHEQQMRGMRRDWHDQQWLECLSCRRLFHAAADHEEHLGKEGEACSMADARLCWMEMENRSHS